MTNGGCIPVHDHGSAATPDVLELIHGLGYRTSQPQGVTGPTRVSVAFRLPSDKDVFWLPRKVLKHKGFAGGSSSAAIPGSSSIATHRVGPRAVREIDNEDHLYLASRSMIPTHNSTLGIDIARTASISTT